MPAITSQEIEKTIKSIQNISIILTGAVEFVCEGRMLKRFSKNIEEDLERLENTITLLKKRTLKKFPEPSKLNSTLSKIRALAMLLKRDDAALEAKCRSGELGNEVSLRVAELKMITKSILDVFVEKNARYTAADEIISFGARLKSFLFDRLPSTSNILKTFIAVILVAFFSFLYLFITMESEDVVFQSIKNDLSYIENQRDILEKKQKKHKEILEKINSFNMAEMERKEKIKWLNLSIKEKKSRELIYQIKLSIEARKKKIAEKGKKIAEIRNKSFLQKLLRQ